MHLLQLKIPWQGDIVAGAAVTAGKIVVLAKSSPADWSSSLKGIFLPRLGSETRELLVLVLRKSEKDWLQANWHASTVAEKNSGQARLMQVAGLGN
ncbi:MAG: hypothetical protein L6R35_003573 [Caloplaca aegaea]|nr:MAG: hypothetical protein L6R35_003573 [Caloplaca aegaea]